MEKKTVLMDNLNISSGEKTFYYYENYRYENLKDAINYAEIDKARIDKKTNSNDKF